MKTLFTKLKLFFRNPTVEIITTVLVLLTFVISYCFLWVLQTVFMMIVHASLILLVWRLAFMADLAEQEYENMIN
jgi:uncharacterized membrane protein YGL010W